MDDNNADQGDHNEWDARAQSATTQSRATHYTYQVPVPRSPNDPPNEWGHSAAQPGPGVSGGYYYSWTEFRYVPSSRTHFGLNQSVPVQVDPSIFDLPPAQFAAQLAAQVDSVQRGRVTLPHFGFNQPAPAEVDPAEVDLEPAQRDPDTLPNFSFFQPAPAETDLECAQRDRRAQAERYALHRSGFTQHPDSFDPVEFGSEPFDSDQFDSAHSDPAHFDSAQSDPAQFDPAHSDFAQLDPAQFNAADSDATEAASAEAASVEPTSTQSAAPKLTPSEQRKAKRAALHVYGDESKRTTADGTQERYCTNCAQWRSDHDWEFKTKNEPRRTCPKCLRRSRRHAQKKKLAAKGGSDAVKGSDAVQGSDAVEGSDNAEDSDDGDYVQ